MLHEELDLCHGSCILKHPRPRSEVTPSLEFFHGQRMWLGDWVVMMNHVHAIVMPFDNWELEDLLGSVKKWTSRHINQWLAEQSNKNAVGVQHNKPRFWQYESYDRIIRDREELARFRKYIVGNADKANLNEGEYTYHRAEWLDQFAPCVA